MFRLKFLAAMCLLALTAPLSAAPPLVTIQDLLFKADGTRFNGVAIIEWKGFDGADGSVVPTQLVTVQIKSGNLRVQLVPTTNVSNGAYYSVRYNSDGRIQFSEIWAVRPSQTPLKLRDVRISRDNLGLPPAPVVQGGGPAFIDSEIPSGVVDGSNTAFTLSQIPVPASSLALYRNGILQKAGVDFTLNSNTVTFGAESTPRSGDILLASYRLTDPENPSGAAGGALTGTFPNPLLADGVVYNSNIAPGAAISEAKLALNYATHSNEADAQVLCSAVGASTSSTAAAQLGSCAVPASALAAGGRIEVRFDVSHEGGSQAFTIQVKWGDTVALSRSASSAESSLGGRVEFGLAPGRVQWSSLNWGAASPLAAGAGSLADPLNAQVVVSLTGQMGSASAETVTLRGFTVIRYPAR